MTEEVNVTRWNGKIVRISSIPITKKPIATRIASHIYKSTLPSGRFCLQAYSPYPETEWVSRSQESKVGELHGKLKTIAYELQAAAPRIASLVAKSKHRREERQRQWELERLRLQQEQEAKWRARVLQDSKDELAEIITGWSRAKQIEEFFLDAERRAGAYESPENMQILDRLRKARDLAGGIDALARFRSWRAPDER